MKYEYYVLYMECIKQRNIFLGSRSLALLPMQVLQFLSHLGCSFCFLIVSVWLRRFAQLPPYCTSRTLAIPPGLINLFAPAIY